MSSDGESLEVRLRTFVEGHPGGWDHRAWEGLLGELRWQGIDTADPDGIGARLERLRVLSILEGVDVKGLGPRRREALAARFRTLWNLKQATADEIAELPTIHRSLAEAVEEALR